MRNHRIIRAFILLWSCWACCAAASPASEAAALKAIISGAKASHSDAMIVLRDGKPLAKYYRGDRAPGPIEMMSATKSVVALAIGRLIGQGKLRSLDVPVYRFYPEWKQGEKKNITVRMLLNMTSGLENVPNAGAEIYPAPDAIKLALAAEMSDPPGKVFSYNNKAVNLLAGIVKKASGEPMDAYLQHALFKPMGISSTKWDDRDKAGHPYAMDGWKASASDAAEIGELVLANGNWHGDQLIPKSYISEMLNQSQPFNLEYGLLWWRDPAWQRYHVDNESVERMRDAGVSASFRGKLAPLIGQTFASHKALFAAIAKALGENWKEEWFQQIVGHKLSAEDLFHVENGPIVAYEANGYLGQYIVVVPSARLVAVRQIARPAEYQGGPWPYDYDDFVQRVIALAQTYIRISAPKDQSSTSMVRSWRHSSP